jgi:hypothetical protein
VTVYYKMVYPGDGEQRVAEPTPEDPNRCPGTTRYKARNGWYPVQCERNRSRFKESGFCFQHASSRSVRVDIDVYDALFDLRKAWGMASVSDVVRLLLQTRAAINLFESHEKKS